MEVKINALVVIKEQKIFEVVKFVKFSKVHSYKIL